MIYDLAIVGSGPGGYTAAICAAREGMRVLLVERDRLGGTCLNRGCIPTKSYYYDAKLFHAARSSDVLLNNSHIAVDFAKMLERKRRVVGTLCRGLEHIIHSHGITVAVGQGDLLSPREIRITPHGSEPYQVRAANIILATGSRPTVPRGFTVDGRIVQTTDEALNSPDLPQQVVIIGAGVIGIEMASIYINLGARVSLIEMLPDILFTEDADVRAAMREILIRRGAKVHLESVVLEISKSEEEAMVLFKNAAGEVLEEPADRVLLATGRSPVLDGLDVNRLDMAFSGRFVRVDKRMRTSISGVYAIGDLVGGMMLAHKAAAEGEAAVADLKGVSRPVQPHRIPRCIWGLAEIGAIGLTEEEAKAARPRIRVSRFPYQASGAAHALGETDGFVKLIGDPESGEILGVHIIGAHATELISEASTAMSLEAFVEDLCEGIKPHPTVSETLSEAALNWNNKAVHLPASRWPR